MADIIPQGGVYDLTVFEGGDFTQVFAAFETDTDGNVDETAPISLTGYTGRSQIRARANLAGELLATFTVTMGPRTATVDVVALEDNELELALPADTPHHKGFYDVELVAGSRVVPFVRGAVTLIREVTDA